MSTKSTREACIRALTELAEKDSRYVFVSADSQAAARATPFVERFPDRCYDVGIAEQNAVGFAAGLASCGLIPFVITYSGFLTMRACEQLRTFVAYPGLKVRLVGLNGGLFGGEREGVTHQFFEDLGIVRSIPGITVATPADANQAYHMTKEIADIKGPAFLRLGSGREHEVYDEKTPCRLGKLNIVRDYGRDAVIFSSGYILSRAIDAAEKLKAQGINAVLADVTSLKPLDEDGIAALLKQCGCAVTFEDHNIIGGLGSAVCETASGRCPVPVMRIGLRDEYPRSGKAEELLDHCGISAGSIISAVKHAISMKA